MKKFFSTIVLAAVAALGFGTVSALAADNWSVVAAWDSSNVTAMHGQGGIGGGAITLVGESKNVNVLGIQANGSKHNLQGTFVYDSNGVNVTTYQADKHNIAGSAVLYSTNTSVYTEQTSNGNLSVVGVVDSQNVDIDVIQGELVVTSTN